MYRRNVKDGLEFSMGTVCVVGNLMKVLAAIRRDVYEYVRNPASRKKLTLVAKLDTLMKANLSECSLRYFSILHDT